MIVAAAAVFAAALAAVSVVDLRERRIPNVIVLPAAAVVLVLHTLADRSWDWLLAALIAFGVLLVVAIVARGGFGMGDVKLALLLGAMLGRDIVLALLVGFALAAVPSLVLVALGRRRATLPLAPFLAVGGLAVLPFAVKL